MGVKRREALKRLAGGSLALLGFPRSAGALGAPTKGRRPNVLFAIADDQSWAYAGAYGCGVVHTPSFDRVAREGILFSNAFCPAPHCSPSRAGILTGRNIWQLEEAGTHSSSFPKKFSVYPDLLEQAGYRVGYTGKGWAPGNFRVSGRTRNPAGTKYNLLQNFVRPSMGISSIDYAANFERFLSKRSPGQPFCFWYGGHEPHRPYGQGSGARSGKDPREASVPTFLPDHPVTRQDLLDFALEVDWFDSHLGKMIKALEKAGELDNTLVVVTADNGMPFPGAKANNFEYGTHMPLAMRWPEAVRPGRKVDDLVGLIDLAPTFLEIAGVPASPEMTGASLLPILAAAGQGAVDPSREFVVTGRERHSHARADNLGYPCRAIRTRDHLYIWNVKPERWPAGDPEPGSTPRGYYDIDGSPTKSLMLRQSGEPAEAELFRHSFGKRPEEELYEVRRDPGCLTNLAPSPEHAGVIAGLRDKLRDILTRQGDPRLLGHGDIFESYPRYGVMRCQLGGFCEQGKRNPAYE